MTNENIKTFPIQVQRTRPGTSPAMPQVVVLKAYEVYCHIYSPQPAMITGGCRGGFCVGELIAFLYAASFPKNEWEMRAQEAFKGMVL